MLEAHTGLCGGTGRCPGCGARLEIPFIGRFGRPDRARVIDAPSGDQSDESISIAPVHAYAADGSAAPQIVEIAGEQRICCPQCQAFNPVDADACATCGLPFTADAAGSARQVRRLRYGSLAWMLGVASVILFPLGIPAVAAIFWGVRTLLVPDRGGTVGAWVGVALGCTSLIAGMAYWWAVLR